jgi:hypothetical protein
LDVVAQFVTEYKGWVILILAAETHSAEAHPLVIRARRRKRLRCSMVRVSVTAICG